MGLFYGKIGSRLQIAFFYFIDISNPPLPLPPPAYLILPNVPIPSFIRDPRVAIKSMVVSQRNNNSLHSVAQLPDLLAADVRKKAHFLQSLI